MAKKTKIQIDIEVNGKMQKATVSAKKLREALDGAAAGQKRLGRSAGETDRKLKGAAQATSNSTKEFAKMSQGMGGLVQVYATIAAQVFAVSAAFQFLKSSAEISNLIKGQEAMGAVTGVAYQTITKSLKDATDGQLQYAEAAKAAAIGTAAGLSPQQLERLGVAAKNTSLALGRDLTDSFNRLIRGVTKAEPELLDELGIVLRLEEATREYAQALGKPVKELNQFERSQAVVNNVLDQAESKFGAIQEIMDPSATSLNRFLASFDSLVNTFKSGLIEKLVPVFDFLSDRTAALTASLALFALPIVKAILPSFDAMAESADRAIALQEERLGDLSSAYEKTNDDIRALGASKDEALKMTSASGADIYKGIGIDPKKARTKAGFGAADFLTGGATSAKAQANAKKVLANAEAQIKKHGRVITGQLAGASKQQVMDLRRAYDRKSAILKKYEVQHGASWKKSELQIKSYATKGRMHILSLQKTVTRAGKRMAGALNAAFRFAGFLGLVALVVDLGKAIYEYFNPISPEAEKANAAVAEFKSTMETLNPELERMEKVRADTTLRTLEERVVALGNAFSSADLFNKIQEFEALDSTADDFDGAKKEMEKLISTLSKLSPAFAEVAKDIDVTDISKETKREMVELANEFVAQGVAASSLAESLKTVRNELAKLAGSGKTVDPTLTLRTALATAKTNAQGLVAAAERDLGVVRSNVEARAAGADPELQALRDRDQQIVDTYNSMSRRDQNVNYRSMKAERKQIEADIAALEKKIAEELPKQQKDLEEKTKELARQRNQLNFITAQEEEFNKISKSVTERQKSIFENTQKIAKEKTLGITIDQKLKNIELDRLSNSTKILEAEQRNALAQAAKTAAIRENSGATEEQKAAAIDAAEAAQNNLTITRAQVALDEEKLDITEDQVNFQKVLNQLKAEEITKQQRLNNAVREEKRIKSGISGSFGFGRASELAAAQEQKLTEAVTVAKQAETEAKTKLTEANRKYLAGQLNLAAFQQAYQAYLTSQNSRKDAELDLDIFRDRSNELVRGLEAQLEMTEARRAALSLYPPEQKYQEFLLDAKAKGITLTEQQKSAVRALIEEQYISNRLLAAQENIYKSVEQGMTSAFASIIDGTKSVKQAFLNMGQMILQVIARVIAEMIALKIMQTIIGLGTGPATFADGSKMSSLQTSTGIEFGPSVPVNKYGYRYGGIAGKEYSMGGIASGPQAGYPAMLHGTEAVVPLPNGKSIPVDMKGAGQQNNVVVNVSVDNQGNATQDTQASNNDAGKLGTMIASAVQKELQNQKRAGGILSPMGVS